MFRRDQGKLVFFTVRAEGAEVQIMASIGCVI